MLLNAICTPDVVCCAPATTALAAARLMRRKHTGDLVVVADEGGERVPLGIITDRDIVVEVLGNDLDPASTSVSSVIRSPVVIGREDEDVAEALERMRVHGVRRMPVVSGQGRLIGIVTLDDLLKLVAADVNNLVDVVSREQGREQRTRR